MPLWLVGTQTILDPVWVLEIFSSAIFGLFSPPASGSSLLHMRGSALSQRVKGALHRSLENSLLQYPVLQTQLREITRLHQDSASLCRCQVILFEQQAGAVRGLNSFVYNLSGITTLLYLMSNVRKLLFHLFFPFKKWFHGLVIPF